MGNLGVLAGTFAWTCRAPDGKLRWADTFPNGTTTEGVNAWLNQVFRGAVTSPTWYMGIIDHSGFSALAVGDTYNSHPGWAEWTFYTGNRPAWTPQGAAGGLMATLLASQWVMAAGGNLRGAFLADSATKGVGLGPVLYAQAVRPTPRAVLVGDTISVTYVIRVQEP